MFGTQIRIGSRMLNCIHIFRKCALPPSGPNRAQRQQSKVIPPPMFGTKIRIESRMLIFSVKFGKINI